MLDSHIKYAHVLSGAARGTSLDDEAMRHVLKAETLGWVHLDGTHADSASWITSTLITLIRRRSRRCWTRSRGLA